MGIAISRSVVAFSLFWFAAEVIADEPGVDAGGVISGVVLEGSGGAAGVPVTLWDAESGRPLAGETYEPLDLWRLWGKVAVVVTDSRGDFRFEGVPPGRYRLVAQQWSGPFRGVGQVHGSVIQQMGVADDVVVPRPDNAREALVVLAPLGEGIVCFDQKTPNNETFLLLSTAPPEFDPILGPVALGPAFLRNIIGMNRMPYGKTTVLGTPTDKPLYAFFIAADNSPGFATLEVPVSANGFHRMPTEPFVAGWSNGRHAPPEKLAELQQFLKEEKLSVNELLEVPPLSSATSKEYSARLEQLRSELAREVQLPHGRTARVGDLLAAESYRRLAER